MWDSLHRFWLFDDPRSHGARAILRGVAEGLRRNGKEVRVFPLNPDDPSHARVMREDLTQCAPDAVFLANHPSSLFLQSLGLSSLNTQFFVWILDNPYMMGDEAFSQQEIVLVSDPAFKAPIHAREGNRVHFLPVAAPDYLQGELTAEKSILTAYVGSAITLKHFVEQIPADVKAYFDRIVQFKLKQPDKDFSQIMEENLFQETKRIGFTGQVGYFLYTEANRLNRLRYLLPLADCGLQLYGNPAWEGEIKDTPIKNCFYGPLEPFAQYPKVIQSTKINVNLRSLQGFTAPTHRDFLVPHLNSFLVASKRHGKPIQNEEEWTRFDLDSFPWPPEADNPQNMGELVRFYLDRPNKREEWITTARREIQQKHLYTHRMAQLGEILRGYYWVVNLMLWFMIE